MATYPAMDLKFALGPGAGTLLDMLYAELDEFEPVAIHEHETGDGWRVFFRTAVQRDNARRTLASEFGNALLQLAAVDVDDEDWARRSQASLSAVRVGRIVVAPPWASNPLSLITHRESSNHESSHRESSNHESSHRESSNRGSWTPDRDVITIIIDPSTGFGTGHHATTRLCLDLLQRRNVSGKRVIDVGTGSGVLAIAAWKLGAAVVIAIDNDPDALQNARDNVNRNGAAEAIEVDHLDLRRASLERADIVLANLTAAVIERHATALLDLVAPAGALILSGFSGGEMDEVAGAFHTAPEETRVEGEWAAVVIRTR